MFTTLAEGTSYSETATMPLPANYAGIQTDSPCGYKDIRIIRYDNIYRPETRSRRCAGSYDAADRPEVYRPVHATVPAWAMMRVNVFLCNSALTKS